MQKFNFLFIDQGVLGNSLYIRKKEIYFLEVDFNDSFIYKYFVARLIDKYKMICII